MTAPPRQAAPRPAESRPAASSLAIRRLWPTERAAMREHLLRLDRKDRELRFCHAASDAVIAAHCEGLDWLRATVLGAFVGGELRGVAELIRVEGGWPPAAELALSVEAAHQDRGIGSALLRHALVTARNRLIGRVYMVCLGENRKMQHLAHKFEASLAFREGQVEGEIFPPWPSHLSLIEEVAAEGQALFLAAFELPLAAAPQILDKLDKTG
jgi:GNAT superfamily N-acetyltransferase